ncbi:unnamed protein product [Clonostachys chloroleuca]|uniref:Uncharacterized protein n=1 Tax=Clonostachys chloroleuca TaxID=1926264 RepID=A0AA35LZ22_9HYPO|nr:unnamed protein product [Clonostachys chloroleuca]
MTKGEEETNSHVPAHFDPRYLRGPTWATPSRNSYVPAPCRCLVRHRWRPGHPQPPWLTTPLQLLSTVEQSRSGSACNASWKQDAILPSVGKFLSSAAFRFSSFLLSLKQRSISPI